MTLFADPAFWALIGLLLFFAVVIYFKVPGSLGKQLDERAERISKELDEARKMRDEAQELLASYQRRQREAEVEAETIVEAAKKEAKRIREQARTDLEERIERRTRMAEAKIAQAEQEAAAEVKAAAADLAAEAAEKLVRDKLDDKGRKAIFKDSLDSLEQRL